MMRLKVIRSNGQHVVHRIYKKRSHTIFNKIKDQFAIRTDLKDQNDNKEKISILE